MCSFSLEKIAHHPWWDKYIFLRTLRECKRNQIFFHSSSLSFLTLISLIPGVIVSLSLMKWFVGLEKLVISKMDIILEDFIGIETLQKMLMGFLTHSLGKFNGNQFGFWGTFFLVLTVFALFSRVQWIFDQIWIKRGQKPFWKKVMNFSIIMLSFTLFFSSTIWLRVFLNETQFGGELWVLDSGIKYFVISIPFLTGTIFFGVLFKMMPNRKIKLKNAILAGLLTAFLWEGTKMIFAIYASKATNWHLLYGSMVMVPVFLIWLQLGWNIILFGVNFLKAIDPELE